MFSDNQITNTDLKICKEEYDKLQTEKHRIELQEEAILTMASLRLEKLLNLNRLDFAHLSNAYSTFAQNDLESMQFKIVDMTIRDLFFENELDFEFVTINPINEFGYEYLYKNKETIITIKIPSASTITKDNIDKLNWGVFAVYEILKTYNTGTELLLIVKSDDTTLIKSELTKYLKNK